MSITVYAREEEVPAGVYLSDCAVSGGSLPAYLDAVRTAAEGRLCVVLSPVYMDFPLPCPTGVGTILSAQQLRQLRGNAPCYFSKALCTEYFTYLKDGQAHVVLFDSPNSLRAKLQAIQAAGISMVLIPDANLRKTLQC